MERAKRWIAAGTDRWEDRTQVAIMLAIGAAGAAMSWTHVHDVAAGHGQGGWKAWADAVVLELAAVASGLEMRRRRRSGRPVRFPATVMAVAVALSLGAQLVAAEASPVGWLAAALPTGFFLAMVYMALHRPAAQVAAAVFAPVVTSPVPWRPPVSPTVATVRPPLPEPALATVTGGQVASRPRPAERVATAVPGAAGGVAGRPVAGLPDTRSARVARVLAALEEDPKLDGQPLADRVEMPRTTARRIRDQLVAAGRVAA